MNRDLLRRLWAVLGLLMDRIGAAFAFRGGLLPQRSTAASAR